MASEFEHKVSYSCDEVNKAEEDVWLVYPWENVVSIEPKDVSKKHFYISLVKSVVRIGAGVILMTGNFVVAGLLLIGAEGLGIGGNVMFGRPDNRPYWEKMSR